MPQDAVPFFVQKDKERHCYFLPARQFTPRIRMDTIKNIFVLCNVTELWVKLYKRRKNRE